MTLHHTLREATTLRAALTRLLPFSGRRLDELMAQGLVRRGGVKLKSNMPLMPGDELEILLPRKFLPKVPVLAEDEHLLVVEKAPGMEVTGEEGLTLEALLRESGYPTARACHRLDVWTGGIVMLALTDAAEEAVRAALEDHRMRKVYRAVTVGIPRPSEALSTVYLTKDARKSLVRIHSSPRPGAVTCITGYRVLASRGDLAMVEVSLFTGRTHQIRAHMAYLGYPLLGDDKYGSFEKNKIHGLSHTCLWAAELGFPSSLPAPIAAWSDRTFASTPRFPEKVTRLFPDDT